MRFLFLLLSFFVVTGIAVSSAEALEDAWQGPFFFVQMSDVQLTDRGDGARPTKRARLFEETLEKINHLRPAFVVITGDLISSAGNDEQWNEFKRLSEGLDETIPLYLLPGNHDIENTPSLENLVWYRKRVGPDWMSFQYGGCSFILLNSTIIKAPRKIPQETSRQWEWVEGELESPSAIKSRHLIVFQHHPLYLKSSEEMHHKWNLPEKARRRLLDHFKDAGVKAIFSGHLHRNHETDTESFVMASTDYPGARIVKVYEDRLEHVFYLPEELPEEIPLY